MFRKALLYGTPVYLYFLELLLRSFANVQSESIAGPTIAGAGIGFLIPLFQLKPVQLDPALQKQLAGIKAQAYSAKDKTFSDFVIFFFFLSLAMWMYSLYLSLKPMANPLPAYLSPLTLGCVIFVSSIILSEIKERV
jgi:hypothetical protein